MLRMRMLQASGLAVALSMAAPVVTARADEVGQPVKAVWQVQEIYLSYFGLTTYYSCDGLHDKVRLMISQLGANESSLVTGAGCSELSGPERLPGARIILATARAATPEALADIAKDPKRAELIARLERKGTKLDAGEFNAVRKTVALNTKNPASDSGAGDCELVEHMRSQVVKKIDARIVKDDVHCTPGQGSIGNRQLQVEVLVKT
jgi:hypothetical protein